MRIPSDHYPKQPGGSCFSRGLPRLYRKGTAAMNMSRKSARYRLAAAAAAATLAGGAAALAAASPAAADYGQGAVYQVELSANASGRDGGGVWLWFGLNRDHTGDYQGSDCGHGGAGAAHDGGDVTWKYINNGKNVEIDGVVLNGLPDPATGKPGFPTTVTVPAAYGHYTGTLGSFIVLPPFIPPNIGTSQLQVAP
jgi:hypothetical protein